MDSWQQFYTTLRDNPELFMDMRFMITNKQWWTATLFDNENKEITYTVMDAIFRPYWKIVRESMYTYFKTHRLYMWVPAEFTHDNSSMQITRTLSLEEFAGNFKIPNEVKDEKYRQYVQELEDLIELYRDINYP